MMLLIRFIVQIALVAALAIGLADQPGTAHIVWHDTVIDTSAAFLAFCVAAIAYAFHLLLRLFDFLRRGPTLWRMGRAIDKIRQSQKNITLGLIALAAGNATEAGRLAVAARKSGDPSITSRWLQAITSQWLQAEAARLAGDHHTAHGLYAELVRDRDAAVLGYRGLIMAAKRADDWQQVDQLADALAAVKPDTPWLNLIRLQSAVRRGAWDAAETALKAVRKTRLLDVPTARQTTAAVRLAVARAAFINGDADQALRAAEQATQQAPDWLPATIGLAQALTALKHHRTAKRLIERSWMTMPHPQLAEIFTTHAATPLDAFKLIEGLCRKNENAPASRLALAEAALAAQIWGEARRHLMASVNDRTATQTTYRLLGQLEQREHGDDRAAAAWILRMQAAPHDVVWLCRACYGRHEAWQPNCGHCGSFNRINWQSVGQADPTAPNLLFGDSDHD